MGVSPAGDNFVNMDNEGGRVPQTMSEGSDSSRIYKRFFQGGTVQNEGMKKTLQEHIDKVYNDEFIEQTRNTDCN